MRHALHVQHDFSNYNADSLAPVTAPSRRPWTYPQSCIDSAHLFPNLQAQPLPCLAAYLSWIPLSISSFFALIARSLYPQYQ